VAYPEAKNVIYETAIEWDTGFPTWDQLAFIVAMSTRSPWRGWRHAYGSARYLLVVSVTRFEVVVVKDYF
jgi:hypothetical protein